MRNSKLKRDKMLDFFLLIVEEGDKQKFQELYQSYKHRMLYIAKEVLKEQALAEDAVQDSFLYLAINIRDVGDVQSPKTRNYVYLVTKHKAIDILRKRTKEKCISEPQLEYISGSYDHVEKTILENQAYEQILKSILALPGKYRECLELNIVYDMPAKRIAALTGIKHETVKKRIQRGKEILRKSIQ